MIKGKLDRAEEILKCKRPSANDITGYVVKNYNFPHFFIVVALLEKMKMKEVKIINPGLEDEMVNIISNIIRFAHIIYFCAENAPL